MNSLFVNLIAVLLKFTLYVKSHIFQVLKKKSKYRYLFSVRRQLMTNASFCIEMTRVCFREWQIIALLLTIVTIKKYNMNIIVNLFVFQFILFF